MERKQLGDVTYRDGDGCGNSAVMGGMMGGGDRRGDGRVDGRCGGQSSGGKDRKMLAQV